MRVYGGPGDEGFAQVCATSDGGLVAAGRSASAEGDVAGNRGGFDAWILKLDGTGNVTWKLSLGGGDDDWASSIAELSGGGFLAAGGTRSGDGDFGMAPGAADGFEPGDLAAWAARLGPDGSVKWIKTFRGVGWAAKAVLEAPDGGFAVMGEVDSPEDGCSAGPPCGNLVVVRLDGEGNTLRVRRPRAHAILPGNAAAGVPGGGAVVVYEVYAGDGAPEARVTRAGPEGRHLWTRTLSADAAAYAVSPAGGDRGGFVGAGQAARGSSGGAVRRPWIFSLSPEGRVRWEAFLDHGLNGEFHGVAEVPGLFFAAGAVESPGRGGVGVYDLIAAATDVRGRVLWTLTLGGSGVDWGESVAAFPGGRIAIGGTTSSADGDLGWRGGGDTAARGDSDGWIVTLAPTPVSTAPGSRGSVDSSRPSPSAYGAAPASNPGTPSPSASGASDASDVGDPAASVPGAVARSVSGTSAADGAR
jgi:hypothetical protein